MDFEKKGADFTILFAAGAASLDNLPLLKLSTLNYDQVTAQPPRSQKALKFSATPQFACTKIHAPNGYSPRFFFKKKGVFILR